MHEPRTLLDLQVRDLGIRRAEKQLDELPEKRAILEVRHKAEEVRALRVKAEDLAHRLEREAGASDDEVSGIDAKITEVQATLDSGSVSNPKEVHNLAREMDALKRRKDKVENDTLQTMERIEKARGQVDKVDAALEQLATREEQLVARFREKGGEVQSALARLKSERDAFAAALMPELLERYEAARSAKAGIGAAQLEGNTCSGCRVELPIERVRDLREGPEIGLCPHCRRLLVVRGLEDE